MHQTAPEAGPERLWAALGLLVAALEPFWAALDRSWAFVGRSWLVFGRFLIDFRHLLGSILGSFITNLAAESCQVRSKTRLESISASKMRIFTE